MPLSDDYRLFETEEYRKALDRLGGGTNMRMRIKKRLHPQLKQEPHYGPNIRKLRDYDPPTWRYRLSDYRIFYAISDEERIVSLLTIDHRKDAYR